MPEVMETDVLIVGGGAAGLSCAIRLQQNIARHNEQVQSGAKSGAVIADPMIVVLEKGPEIGAHSFSGAVMRPDAMTELFPDWLERGCPVDSEVKKDAVYFLGRNSAYKIPATPPPFKNHGNYIVSLSKVNRWLGQQAEALGINIFPGFAAVEALYEGDRIVGVRTGDKGRDKHGNPKSNFEEGLILKSKVTIFAEGVRGSLFKQVAKKIDLYKDRNPDVYEEGVKEIIQMPPGTVEPGQVIHTLGFPLNKSIGGTFIYTLPNDRIIVGLVGYLDTKDPLFNPHRELQRLKTHPWMQKMLKGGQVVAYGGKCLPAGGWYSMPKLFGDGFMAVGDTASMVDVQKLKGIHLAMKSGIAAADTAVEALVANDSSAHVLQAYEKRVQDSYIKSELYRVRNFHQTLSMGVFESLPLIALQEITGGRGLFDRMKTHPDYQTTETVVEVWGAEGEKSPDVQLPQPDNKLFYDKLSSVYMTGTLHDEDSPNHLLVANRDVCREVCEPTYKSPCNAFCPANVYEMVPDEERNGSLRLQVNYTNCIHCKTCDIKCPFDNITWTVPEGGGGPRYQET
jgi:electron-transferring-flavoprotein dehydrogenase